MLEGQQRDVGTDIEALGDTGAGEADHHPCTPVLYLMMCCLELDSKQANYLLNSIHDILPLIIYTGLDEFIESNLGLRINPGFLRVEEGT